MGVGLRRVVAIGVMLVMAALVWLTVAFVLAPDGKDRTEEPAVFVPPSSYCSEARRGFERMVFDVKAINNPGLRRNVSAVRAGLLRKVAVLDDTPKKLRRDVQRLAIQVNRAGASGDFAASIATAHSLDQATATICG